MQVSVERITYSFQKYIALRFHIALYTSGFTIPFIFSQPQLVTGTIVNALLFLAAEKLDKKAVYPLLLLPSLGALAHGVLFGPQTYVLLYFLPFIWAGNYLQVSMFSHMKEQSYALRIAASSASKYLLLYVAATIYYQVHIVPQVFVTSMGLIQLATACMGGVLSYGVVKFFKKR